MAEKNIKPGWKIWRFDQMVNNVNVRIDNPSESGMEHYVRSGPVTDHRNGSAKPTAR